MEKSLDFCLKLIHFTHIEFIHLSVILVLPFPSFVAEGGGVHTYSERIISYKFISLRFISYNIFSRNQACPIIGCYRLQNLFWARQILAYCHPSPHHLQLRGYRYVGAVLWGALELCFVNSGWWLWRVGADGYRYIAFLFSFRVQWCTAGKF